MSTCSHLFVALSCFFAFSCSQHSENQSSMNQIKDPHSFANPLDAEVTHQHFDLKIDFIHQKIEGTTRLTVQNHTRKSVLILDTKNLDITGVFLNDFHQPTAYSFLPEDSVLGKGLKISISSDKEQEVLVQYKTTDGAHALQWLNENQTMGKKHPFLFTQGQAILSRTWFPCQDGPGMRFTYSADITVDNGLKVVMSAEKSEESSPGHFHFEMSKPIPAYLVAMSAGNLAFKEIDKRTGVYAEPEMLERSAFEFSEMGKMVEAAEALYGSYRWGRYDVLVLPPSFPFGGMENPCVTFATPTILAGDRSLTSLIAHELAHSWSGNLVTNATWNDFWLNEGFTVYFERRIMERIEGKEYAEMLARIGYDDLQETLQDMGIGSPASCLKLKLEGKDPDDGMNDVAYEKGYLLLCTLEKAVGREKWDVFLRQYFDMHAFQSMDTERFLSFLDQKLLKANGLSVDGLKLKSWIYEPGLPKEVQTPVSTRFSVVEKIVADFIGNGQMDVEAMKRWSSHEWVHFLRNAHPAINIQKMAQLDSQFHISASGNSEVLFQWLLMGIRHKYAVAEPALENFLMVTGRRKFVLPLYTALIEQPTGILLARKIYARARSNYHSVTFQSVDALFAKHNIPLSF